MSHPRTRPNLLYLTTSGYARITPVDREYAGVFPEITTCRLHEGRYVREDDGKSYPQLCYGCARRGVTITYHDPQSFAAACDARLSKTLNGYLKAIDEAKAAYGYDEPEAVS